METLELDFDEGPSLDFWLPGETLFSFASRHHVLTGHAKASETCMQLFGHPRIGSAHDLPGRVNQFARRTRGRYGTAETVIRERTILPYYLPFRSAHDSVDAFSAMSGDATGALKARLGIMATRFGAAHPLKACQRCIHQDETQHRVAYWHIEHQLPGVWICPWHGDVLLVAQVKWMGVDRFGWYLPSTAELSLANSAAGFQTVDLDVLQRLANAAVSLWALPSGVHFSGSLLAQIYREVMVEKELRSESGRIRTIAFGTAIAELTHSLAGIREFSALPISAAQVASQFSRLVTGPRSIPHPLRHLIMILALFDRWETFWQHCQNVTRGSTETKRQRTEKPDAKGNAQIDRSDMRAGFVKALEPRGGSVRAAALDVGISVATAMVWAAAAGVAVRRRPKHLTPDVRVKLIRVLRRGADKMAAAKAFGVSVQTVTTTLRTEVGLHERWTQARFDRAQREARSAWAATASHLKVQTPKAMRALQPAVFAWLYRNDRAWLDRFASRLPHVPKTNHGTINWDRRDEQLSFSIKEAILAWHETNAVGRLTIARLCQLTPDLKRLLSKLDRMPLTRAALSHISARRHKQSQTL